LPLNEHNTAPTANAAIASRETRENLCTKTSGVSRTAPVRYPRGG
jgi:hypothetical protein